MKQRTLGQSPTKVSALGLGCMGMSEFFGATDDAQSLATLARAPELGVTFLDHCRNPGVPIEDLMGTLAERVRAGKVGQVGWSEVSVDTLRKDCAVHPVGAVQSEDSLWSREPQNGMLRACAELGTTFVADSPLGRAFLTGTVASATLSDTDFRKHKPRCSGPAEAVNRELVDGLSRFAEGSA